MRNNPCNVLTGWKKRSASKHYTKKCLHPICSCQCQRNCHSIFLLFMAWNVDFDALTLDSRHMASLNCWTGKQQELRIWNEDWGNFVFSPPSSPTSSDAKICQAVRHFDMSGALRCEQPCPVVAASPEITFSEMGPTFTCCENNATQNYHVIKRNNNIF